MYSGEPLIERWNYTVEHVIFYGRNRISDAVFIGVLICVGVVGNALIITSVIVKQKLRRTTNYLVCNVAASDFLVTGIVLPTVLGNIIRQESVLNEAGCVFTSCVMLISCGVSLISFAIIAFNRYIGVCHPAKYVSIFTTKTTVVMLVMVWVFSVTTVAIGLVPGVCEHYYQPDLFVCTFNMGRVSYIYFYILISLGIVGPALLTAVFYSLIYVKIKKTGQGFRSQSTSGSRARSNTMVARQQRENRAILCMLLAFLLFVVLWFPFVFIVVLENFTPIRIVIRRIAIWSALGTSSVDWIVYGVMNKNFRDAFKHLLFPWLLKRRRDIHQ